MNPDEDVLVLIHAFDEQILQQALEHELELVARVDRGRLPQTVVGHGRFDDLVEEELIGLVEVRAETLVHDVDELRKRYGLRPHQAAADLSGAVEGSSLAIPKRDGSLADLLQAVVLEPYLVIEPVRRATLATWQLRREMAQEHVQPFEIRVLVRNHLAQESIQVQERQHLAAPVFRLLLAVVPVGRET